MSNYIEQAAETIETGQTIQAHLRQASEHKIAMHVDAAFDVVDTDSAEAYAWAYEAGKEAWEFDLQAPKKLASHPALSVAFKRGFDSVEQQACSQREVSNPNEPDAFNYQLLARLKQDCEYYLGHGNRAKKHLWAGDEAEQIAKMKELYSGFNEKPEWISLEDIEAYEAKMVEVTVETLEQAPRPC
jgi:hypothetical protein